MPDVTVLLAGVLGFTLNLYAVLGGADYGGGVWDLLASGPRASDQRRLIGRTLAPVWEANHVWLVLAVVILFTGFPPAFGVMATALHVPLTLMLVGIVLRGASFVFRAYGRTGDPVAIVWGRVFAIASLATPLLLGMVVGAVTEGQVRVVDGQVASSLLAPWLSPFAILVGVFALALFAFSASVFLTLEADTPALAEDFRHRALAAGVLVAVAAGAVFGAAGRVPELRAGLVASPWAIPLHAATGTAALLTFGFLYRRHFRWARWTAVAQVSCIVWGWALTQYPFLIRPDVTIAGAAAPAATVRLLLMLLAAGAVVLFPSLAYLFSLFDPRADSGTPDRPDRQDAR